MARQYFKHLIVGLLASSTLSVYAADFDVTSQSGEESVATSLPGIINTNTYIADGDRVLYDSPTADTFTTILAQDLELDLSLTISTKDAARDLFIGVSLDDGTYSSTLNVVGSSSTMTGFVTVQNDVVFTNEGTLTINSVEGVASPTYNGTFSGDGDLVISGSQNSIFNGVLSQVNAGSNLSLTKNGTGGADVFGNCTYAGDTLVNTGVLDFGGNITNLPSDITIASGAILSVGSDTAGGSQHFSGDIDGSGSVLKEGSSGNTLVTFSGDQFYTGDTLIQSGTLSFTGGITSYTGDIEVISGATLDFSPISGAAYGQVLTGDILGFGGVTVNGSNTTTLLGDLSYTGTTVLNSDLEIIGGVANLPSNITINTGGLLSVGSSSNQFFSGDVSGVGDVNFLGSGGTTSFSGSLNYSGTTTMTGSGTLAFLDVTGLSGDISMVDTGVILQVGGGTSVAQSFGGDISGLGAVHKESTGTTTFRGDVSYTGETLVNAGTLAFTGSVTDFDSNISVLGGATLAVGGIGYTQNFDGAITGFGKVTKSESGTTEFSGDCEYVGKTTINAGSLSFTGAVTDLQSAIAISSGATLDFDSTSTQLFSGAISGAGEVTKSSSGTTTISSNPTYTGSTTIGAGVLNFNNLITDLQSAMSIASGATLRVGADGTQIFSGDMTGAGGINKANLGTTQLSGDVGTTGSISIDAGTLLFAGALTDLGSDIAIASGTTLESDSTDNQLFSGAISGSGTFKKNGTGTVTVSGNASLSGFTNIEQGKIAFTGAISDLPSDIFIAEDASLQIGSTSAQLFSGQLVTGEKNSLEKVSSGTTTISGDAYFDGPTEISGGTLAITGSTAKLRGSISIASGATFDYGSPGDATLDNTVFGAGNFIKSGTGVVQIEDSYTYSGNTTVLVDSLIFNSLDYAGDFEISSGANLSVGSTTDQTLSGEISGGGTLSKFGTGTVTLSTDSPITGNTTISAGTLAVNAALSSANVSVNSGATLMGTGSVVNVSNSGSVAPGASIGTLSVLGDYVQNLGGALVNEFDGTSSDLLQVTGSATLNTGSALILDPEENQSYVQDARYTFVTADGGRSGEFSTVSMVANSALDLSQVSIEYFDDHIDLVLNPNEYINNTIEMNSQLSLKTSQAQFNNFRAVNDRNLYSYDWCSGGNCGDKQNKNKTCEEYPCKNQGWDVYALTSYTGFDIKESSKRNAADIKTSATTLGIEYVFDDYGSFGMGVGYTYGQVKNPNNKGSKTKSNAFTVGVNGIYAPIKYVAFDLVGNIDAVWYSMDRLTTANYLNTNATAKPDGTQANAALRVNGRFCLFSALFQPFYSTQYSWRRIDGYTENGPQYTSYEVSRESLSYWNGEGGLMVSKTVKLNNLCYIPHVNVSYVFRYNKPTDTVTVRNIADSDLNNMQNYVIDYLNTNYLKVGGGVDVLNKESFRGYIEANGYIESQLKSSFDVRFGLNLYF